jgi:hypothetical protein
MSHKKTPTTPPSEFPDRHELGYKSELMSVGESGDEAAMRYPRLHLDNVGPKCDCDVGDEGWALVRYCVKSVSAREADDGKGERRDVALDIYEIRFPSDVEGDSEDDDLPPDRKLARDMARASEKNTD